MADSDEERKKFKTVWNINHENNEINEDNYNGAIKANVGYQDEPTIEDWNDLINSGEGTSGMVSNTLLSAGVSSISDIFTTLLTNAINGDEVESEKPKGTESDTKFDDWLVKAKSYNYKNVKLTSTRGLYGANSTVLGGTIGLLTGSVGQTAISNFIDDAVINNLPTEDSSVGSLLTNALGAGIIEELADTLGSWDEKGLTLSELALLVASNYYNMYEARPGRQIRNAHNMYNFVVRGDSESKLGTTGTENESNKTESDITSALSGLSASATSSNWKSLSNIISGGWLANYSKSSSDDNEESETIIIANDRENYIQPIGVALSTEKSQRPKLNGVPYIAIKEYDLLDYVKEKTVDDDETAGYLGVDKGSKIYETVVNRLNSYKKIGFLYIEPFISGNDGIQPPFEIPFEFNPKFGNDTLEAKYNTEELMSRFLSLRTYTGTDAGTLTIEATYMALSPNDGANINSSNYFEWMKIWTPKFIGQIEQAYRSLVFPYLDSSKQVFIRPPIVRVYPSIGTSDNPSIKEISDGDKENNPIYTTVGNLYTYPLNRENGGSTDPIYVTGSLDGFRNMKRYIVTNVDISNASDDDWGTNYYTTSYTGFELVQRRSFKVTLTLAETTKNFLDIIPSFSHYYAATKDNFTYGSTGTVSSSGTTATVAYDNNLDFDNDELNIKDFSLNDGTELEDGDKGSNFLAFVYNYEG